MKKFYCPVNGWDCPYWKKDGTCKMVDEGDDPVKECDDAAVFWDEDDDYMLEEDDLSDHLYKLLKNFLRED